MVYGNTEARAGGLLLLHTHLHFHSLFLCLCSSTCPVRVFFSEYTCIPEASEKVPVTDNQYRVCSDSTSELSVQNATQARLLSLEQRSIVHHLLTKLPKKNNQGKLLASLRQTSSSHHFGTNKTKVGV